MTPQEAYTKLVVMHDADIDNQMCGREICRFIIDTIEDAIDRKDFAYVQEFLGLARAQDVGPRYAIAILRTAFSERNKLQPFWVALRDNCWDYMVELDKPGRIRLMRGLLGDKDDEHLR